MGKIERVTRDDFIREGLFHDFNSVKVYPSQNKLSHAPRKTYIEQLKDKEIAEFFKPLGYREHFFQNEKPETSDTPIPFIFVDCDNMIVLFNDFTSRVYEKHSETEEPASNETEKYADLTNTNVGKMVSDAIAVDFLGRRFSETYPSKKKEFDKNNLETAFKGLPKELRKFFASAHELQQADIISKYNFNAYGTPNIENQIRNS